MFNQLSTMFVHNQSLSTTKITPLVECSDGIILGVSKITSLATTDGYYTAGQSLAPGSLFLCIVDSANSVQYTYNAGTKAAVSIVGLIS